jgi:two-component system chemotaxis response regulator CheY
VNNLDDLRILIVDDEPFMRRTIRAMLRAVGRFIVAEAGDGETALALLATHKPDVVLCDIGMEPMTGLQFVQRLRDHPQHALRDTVVVMVTMHSDAATVRNAVHLDIKGYLVKPISPKQIADRLHIIFRDRQPDSSASNVAPP